MIEKILQYQTPDGRIPFREWLLGLTDIRSRAAVRTRLDRLLLGNMGDCKAVGAGVFELRFHFGPGYRVYFALDRGAIVILLCGGDKHHQERDIRRAQSFWKDYLRRKR